MKRNFCKTILVYSLAASIGASELFARGGGGGGGGGGHIGGSGGGGHIGGGGYSGGGVGGAHVPMGGGSMGGHTAGMTRSPSLSQPGGAGQFHSTQGVMHSGTGSGSFGGTGSRGTGFLGAHGGAVGHGGNFNAVNNRNVNVNHTSFQSYHHSQYYGHWGGHYGGWGGWGGYGFGTGLGFGLGLGLGLGLGYGGYGWGFGYFGYGYPYGWVLGYPLGWGLGAWGFGALGYRSGYLVYYNPYYIGGYGMYGNYSYAQPIPVIYSNAALATSDGIVSPCDQTLNAAVEAFKLNNYDLALDLVNRGIVQCPSDSVMHEFRALVLFARGDYQQAAATIHSVLAVGPGWNWTTLSGLYSDVAVYTAQLRTLEAFTRSNPQDGASRFLLAYHYVIDGYPDSAAGQLQQVVKLVPTDHIAADVLRMISKPAPEPPATTGESVIPQRPAAATPVVTPMAPETLLGTWRASREDGSKFELTLMKDSRFHWKFTVMGNLTEFSGTYKFEGNVLDLERTEGGSLVAGLVPDGTQKFNFKMLGAPTEDPGLNFSR